MSKLLLALLALLKAAAAALAAFFEGGVADDALRWLLSLVVRSDAGKAELKLLFETLVDTFALYWIWLKSALLITVVLALLTLLPLLWRAFMRRRRVFISFQHQREPLARELEVALQARGFRVLRVHYEPGAGHQPVLSRMQRRQRRADAVVCIPGDARSAVDHEVYAASVLQQPVVFLVRQDGGSLPDTADKRYPVLSLTACQAAGYAPVAELLHALTFDRQATWALYRHALRHPLLGLAWAPVVGVLLLVLLAMLLTAFVHGLSVVTGLGGGQAGLGVQAVALQVLVLMVCALPVLAAAGYLALVLRQLPGQLVALWRARLRAGDAEFRREDWLRLLPGLAPGERLHLAMLEAAPLAHHERQAADKAAPVAPTSAATWRRRRA